MCRTLRPSPEKGRRANHLSFVARMLIRRVAPAPRLFALAKRGNRSGDHRDSSAYQNALDRAADLADEKLRAVATIGQRAETRRLLAGHAPFAFGPLGERQRLATQSRAATRRRLFAA